MYKKEDVVEYVSTYQQQLEKIYLPPEMLMNEHAEAVPATDVYRWVIQVTGMYSPKSFQGHLTAIL